LGGLVKIWEACAPWPQRRTAAEIDSEIDLLQFCFKVEKNIEHKVSKCQDRNKCLLITVFFVLAHSVPGNFCKHCKLFLMSPEKNIFPFDVLVTFL